MIDDSPYRSPDKPSEIKPASDIRALLAIVLINIALNAWAALRDASQLTTAHHLVGILLWLVLPALAVFLVSHGRRVGYWILFGLFALRAVTTLVLLGPVIRMPEYIVVSPFRWRLLDLLFYATAAIWLLLTIRSNSGSGRRASVAHAEPFSDATAPIRLQDHDS